MKEKRQLSLERGDLLPSLLLMPALLVVTCIIILPMLYGFIISFFNFRLGDQLSWDKFAGLANYAQVFHDKTALRSLLNTFLFSIGCVSGDLIFGTIISVNLYRLSVKASRYIRPFIIAPMLVAPIVTGLIWSNIFDTNSILYWALKQIGITYSDFPGVSGAGTAMLCCFIAHWWQSVPFVVIVLTAGLMAVPSEIYEAAYCDGAGLFNTFLYIVFPMLKSVYMVVFLISGVDTIKTMDIIFALTKGGPNNATMTLNLYAYLQAFDYVDMSYAMTLSVLVMVIAMCCFGIPFIRYNKRKKEEEQGI